MKAINLYVAFCFTITFSLVSSDDIPTMLWNIKGNSLAITPVSALGDNNQVLKMNIKEALHQEACILVFAVNKLSLEDFYDNDKPTVQNNTLHNIESFLESQPHMLLSGVENPLNYIHKSHCGVQEIVVDNKIDDNVLQAVSKAMQRSCIVILHVADDGIVAENGKLQNVFMPSFENSKNIIGMITGVKSSWSGSDSEHHKFRNLLQTETSEDSKNFVMYEGCIMYAENATISVEKGNTTALPFPPKTAGSSCSNDTAILQLEFTTSGPLDSVTLRLNFTKRQNAWKTYGTVSMTGEKAIPEEDLDSGFVEAPLGFSFSCGKLVLKGKNSTPPVEIVMERFQIQPYEVKKASAFSESFDCVPYFTIPIWMGVFVSILFIIILNIGIYALFSVHTMDRFDDPKGKSISVGAAAD